MKTFRDFGIDLPTNFSGDRKVLCPQCSHLRKKKHEPCLSVNGDKGTWNCHNCGWTGSLHEKGDFQPERKVYRRPDPATAGGDLSNAIVQYFSGRGIGLSTLVKARVYSTVHYLAGTGQPTLCMAFPYYRNGELLNVKYRDARKNMTQEKDPEPCLWNIDAAAGAKTICITEGEIDALSLIECGYAAAVSVDKGAPNAKDADAGKKLECVANCREILDGSESIILVTDKDEPGLRLEKELVAMLGPQKCRKTTYPSDCKDINDVLMKYGPEGVMRVIDNAEPYPVPGIHRFAEYTAAVESLYRNGIMRGASTGWKMLDQIFSLKKGTLNIITGLPSSGKSEFIHALAVNAAKNLNWRWAIFSPEMMPPESLVQNLAEKIAVRSFFGQNRMPAEEMRRAVAAVNEIFYLIAPDSGGAMTLNEILEAFEVCVIRYQVSGVIIDPWNWVESALPPGENFTVHVGKMLQQCLAFARTHKVWFAVLAHPRKPEKDKRTGKFPVITLNDISGSQEFANKADYGISLYRDQSSGSGNITQVHILKSKNKYVATMNTFCEMRWDRSSGTYTDIDPEQEHRYGVADRDPDSPPSPRAYKD